MGGPAALVVLGSGSRGNFAFDLDCKSKVIQEHGSNYFVAAWYATTDDKGKQSLGNCPNAHQ